MTFIDTHAHLYDPQFSPDFDAVLARADAAGIAQVWLPNCARETTQDLLALADRHPDRFRAMMGLHPCYVTETVEDELAAVENHLNSRTFLAVGEIGLDFYWDMTHVDRQFEALRVQLQWAAKRGLAVSLHTRSGHDRNAFAETADVIEKLALPGLRGIFHCFVGTVDEAERAIALGFKLGVGGVVTFKNGRSGAPGLGNVLPHIGLEHLVLETDAPYLAPVPFRGKRNEPSYVPLVAQRVADLKQVSLAEVAEQTTINAKTMIE